MRRHSLIQSTTHSQQLPKYERLKDTAEGRTMQGDARYTYTCACSAMPNRQK